MRSGLTCVVTASIAALAGCGGGGIDSGASLGHGPRLNNLAVDTLQSAQLAIESECHAKHRSQTAGAVRSLIALHRAHRHAGYVANAGDPLVPLTAALRSEASYLRSCNEPIAAQTLLDALRGG